jgi:hypothetical protein
MQMKKMFSEEENTTISIEKTKKKCRIEIDYNLLNPT